MKTITLKNITTTNQISKQTIEFSYKDLIYTCLNIPIKDAFTIDEMRKKIRILELLEKSTDIIEVEDTDFLIIKESINSMDGKWTMLTKDIIDFVDYINSI
jgi:hypothetical protein